MTAAQGRRSDAGFVSVEFLLAVGLSFVILVFLANFIALQYGRGVVRGAADEGARAGSRVNATAEANCEQRASDTLQSLGSMGTNVQVDCAISGDVVTAVASVDFEGWLPGIPTYQERAVARSNKEVAPR